MVEKKKVRSPFSLPTAARQAGLLFLCVIGTGCRPDATAPTGTSPRPRAPAGPPPNVVAELDKFAVDRTRGATDGGEFTFIVRVTNQEPKQSTVYAVVYGKNDAFDPPRRAAWPLQKINFDSDIGNLSPSDITQNWGLTIAKPSPELRRRKDFAEAQRFGVVGGIVAACQDQPACILEGPAVGPALNIRQCVPLDFLGRREAAFREGVESEREVTPATACPPPYG